MHTYHLGVCPPRLSVFVFFASLPSRAAQYGSCLPMVRLLGKFLARSMITTSVPITGPSTVMSEKMPAVWALLLKAGMLAVLVAILPQTMLLLLSCGLLLESRAHSFGKADAYHALQLRIPSGELRTAKNGVHSKTELQYAM